MVIEKQEAFPKVWRSRSRRSLTLLQLSGSGHQHFWYNFNP
ncbi:hypothetical protein [Roseofilum capinflatum]|uniref:Uncharacterized protein n=1 Tax=Roseofilum capinflatum BLCC-M114 TaxID=3022440 RepID=A0ABT7B4S0_9CYAN|nr:hypothetical protein [Roseofilum capinflatum]MDJ1173273.1 hypothetical protein [Roseofilum capinflatum BLCC-M114]